MIENLAATGLATFRRAATHVPRLAIVDGSTRLTYGDLLGRVELGRRRLLAEFGVDNLAGRRVGVLVSPGADHVVAQWSVWAAGGVLLPLAHSHPLAELTYSLGDAAASLLVFSEDRGELAVAAAKASGCPSLTISALSAEAGAPGQCTTRLVIPPESDALILYTSGTTGRPKGAVHTHRSLDAQRDMLEEAWQWQATDRALSVLPLHHLHGLINVVACSLWAGAVCEFSPNFDAPTAWERLASGDITVFMAVPTIYAKLLAAYENAGSTDQSRWGSGASRLRLMVSGSAALPTRILDAWTHITQHRLLERYGMTETGMILSQPLVGERQAGTVGAPLPGVEVRFRTDVATTTATPDRGFSNAGELEVRGGALFRGYWQRPEETAASIADGWFRTGDVAELRAGTYRLLGRRSTDILKSGGYKISALEIEEALREHEAISECAVVGLADEEWGQRVAAAVVLRPGRSLSLHELREWCKERLAPYKSPTLLFPLAELPRNAMGKVQKPQLVELLSSLRP